MFAGRRCLAALRPRARALSSNPVRPGLGATASDFEKVRAPRRRMLELALVRHGQSEGNLAYRRAQEKGDDSLYDGAFMDRHSSLWRLTDRGRDEARCAGDWLRAEVPPYDAWYTSEFLRAMETAALLDLPDARWYAEPNCRERDWGAWDLATPGDKSPREESRRKRAGLYFAPQGGESLAAVILRVDLILAYLNSRYPNKRVLMVCHGELMWAFRIRFEKINQMQFRDLAHAARGQERIHNCSILRYTRRDPETAEVNPAFTHLMLVTPTSDDPAKREPKWRRFRPQSYSNEELLNLVWRYPNIYHNSFDEPGTVPYTLPPDPDSSDEKPE